MEKKKSRARPEPVLSAAERERLEEKKTIKNQLLIFSKLYPELVERASVRYPIEDSLIAKLPELHGATGMRPKPQPAPVLLPADQFDELVFVWEFCNNFAEYLDVPFFKIEELRLALTHVEPPQSDASATEDWFEFTRHRQAAERGLHLVNGLHQALAARHLSDMFGGDDGAGGAAQQ